MKTLFSTVVLALAGIFCQTVPNAQAEVSVSVGVQVSAVADFHGPLAHHGAWVAVGSYGSCWRPAGVAVGWQPYCDGHWEWTDCGWYWVSDEPWGWACYHYGTWYFDSFYGWVWVPGLEWAPAWVYWRVGGGYIGWTPCAPRGVVVVPSRFVFVGASRFHERVRPSTVIVNNTTIINKTTQITELKRETRSFGGKSERVVVNEGPGVDVIQTATGKKLTAVPVQDVDRRTSVPAGVKRRTFEPRRGENTTPLDKSSLPPDKPTPPDKDRPPSRNENEVRPQPGQSPAQPPPAKQSPGTQKGRKGKSSEREKPKSLGRIMPGNREETSAHMRFKNVLWPRNQGQGVVQSTAAAPTRESLAYVRA